MIVDGKKIAQELNDRLRSEFVALPTGARLALIAVDPDPVTLRFMDAKKRLAGKLGVQVIEKIFSALDITEAGLQQELAALARNVNGIVVQLPLPESISMASVLLAIPKECDIDLLSTETYAAWQTGESSFVPPVAAAVMHVLEYHGVNYAGKHIAIVGYGKLVGKPTSDLFELQGIEHDIVTLETNVGKRAEILKRADIVISGVGAPGTITSDQLKSGVVIIDAGTSESGGMLAGDVDLAVADIASLAALVPGGIGPIAISMLFKNLLHAART